MSKKDMAPGCNVEEGKPTKAYDSLANVLLENVGFWHSCGFMAKYTLNLCALFNVFGGKKLLVYMLNVSMACIQKEFIWPP